MTTTKGRRRRTMAPTTLLGVDSCVAESARPRAELLLNEGGELLRRRAGQRESLAVDLLADLRPSDDGVELLAKPGRDLGGHLRGAEQRGEELDVDRRQAGLHPGGDLRQERPARKQGHGEGAEATLPCVREAACPRRR